jgi:outer membrane biosynthesis protein TonB
MGKFIAAGAVLAVLIALVVVVLNSRPSGTEVVAPLAAEPSAVKPSPAQETRTRLEADRQAGAAVPAPGAPTALRDVHRAARNPSSKGGHPSPSLAPPSLEPAPLSADQAAGPRRGADERRVPEIRNRGPVATAGNDGPTEGMIIAVVKKNQSTIKSCYERALKRDDRLRSGRIDVTAELGPSGTVKSVSLTAPPEFATVEACIKMAVRRWAFPTGPKEYRAEFPLIMQGNF